MALPQDGDLSSATHQFGGRIPRSAVLGPPTATALPPRLAREGEDESDWQFNDERPAPGAKAAEKVLRIPARRQSERARGGRGDVAGSLDELGNPESWDFFAANEARHVKGSRSSPPGKPRVALSPAEASASGAGARKPRQASARPVPVSARPRARGGRRSRGSLVLQAER